jgi:hypothetical protein
MNKKTIKIFFVLSLVLFLSAGCLGKPRSGESTKIYEKAAKQLSITQTVQYEGENGKTALQLLKDKYQVQTKEYSGLGEFVEAIGGIKPDSKHFWAFYINGKLSEVGANQYQTKNGDKIEWKLEEVK